MKPYLVRPDIPACGHISARGRWHPGPIEGCAECPTLLRTLWEWVKTWGKHGLWYVVGAAFMCSLWLIRIVLGAWLG